MTRTKKTTTRQPLLQEAVNVQGDLEHPARFGVVEGDIGKKGATLRLDDGSVTKGEVHIVPYHEPGRGPGWRMLFRSKDGRQAVTVFEKPNSGKYEAERLSKNKPERK